MKIKSSLNVGHYSSVIDSPIGKIGIRFHHEKLVKLDFLTESTPLIFPPDTFNQQVINELANYFNDPNYTFKVDFVLQGTPFQQKVWQALQTIESSKTLTYGSLANQLQTGPRAIGQACRTNPLPLIIPCHRIVAKNHLGGFAGSKNSQWTHIKKWLLMHEKIESAIVC